MSFDPDSCTLKYGIGHHMEETTALVYCLPEELRSLYRAAPKLVCLHGYASGPIEPRSVFEAKLRALEGYESATVEFDRCPLITNPPPLIMDSSKLTLMDLGERQILASSDLPPACQVLFGISHCIKQESIGEPILEVCRAFPSSSSLIPLVTQTSFDGCLLCPGRLGPI